MKREVILFDLDGTLADNSHRQKFVATGKKDWDTFFKFLDRDEPNIAIVSLYRGLLSLKQFRLLIVTARPERYRMATEKWLKDEKIEFEQLIMRKDGDRRSDVIVKREMLYKLKSEGKCPLLVVDDRESVVDMWRNEGVTCLQCARHTF